MLITAATESHYTLAHFWHQRKHRMAIRNAGFVYSSGYHAPHLGKQHHKHPYVVSRTSPYEMRSALVLSLNPCNKFLYCVAEHLKNTVIEDNDTCIIMVFMSTSVTLQSMCSNTTDHTHFHNTKFHCNCVSIWAG